MKMLVLLWHPYRGSYAGGRIAAENLLRQTPNDMIIHVLDLQTAHQGSGWPRKIRVYNYKIPAFIHKVRPLPLERLLNWLAYLFTLSFEGLKLSRRHIYDIVYAPCSEQFFVTIPALLIKVLFKSKAVLSPLNVEVPGGTVDGLRREFKRTGLSSVTSLIASIIYVGLRNLNVTLLKRADMVLTNSYDMCKRLNRFGVHNVRFAPPGIDYKSLQEQRVGEQLYDGIFIGRHTPEKGIFDVIEAWALVAKKVPDAKLALVGTCNPFMLKQIEQKISDLQSQKNIVMLGTVSEEEKVHLLWSSKLVIFLSYIEGWGLVPLEGLACGLPVTAYDLDVYKENIKQCRATFLVPVGDYKKAASVVVSLLKLDEKDREQLSNEASRFAADYDYSIMASRTYDVLREIATTPPFTHDMVGG